MIMINRLSDMLIDLLQMPREVTLAGSPLVAEEAVAALVDVDGVEVVRQRTPVREVGVARVAPEAVHGGL